MKSNKSFIFIVGACYSRIKVLTKIGQVVNVQPHVPRLRAVNRLGEFKLTEYNFINCSTDLPRTECGACAFKLEVATVPAHAFDSASSRDVRMICMVGDSGSTQ